MDGLKRAAWIFGKVGTHLIIGLGETDDEAVKIIDELHKSGINAALFSYTYVPGAQLSLEQDKEENLRHYRTVQVARQIIMEGKATYRDMMFSDGILTDFGVGREYIIKIIEDGKAFQTSGCPDCNRPMANETFSRIYNFPRRPDEREKEGIKRELGMVEK